MPTKTTAKKAKKITLQNMTIGDVRRALKKVRTKLLNGKISAEQFDMEMVMRKDTACGTVGCIGGYMALEMGAKMRRYYSNAYQYMDQANILDYDANHPGMNVSRYSGRLYNMFFEFPNTKKPITPSQGAKAITRYLDGKKPWYTRRAA